MTLIDYVVVQDPEGKPLPLRNIIVLTVRARHSNYSIA
jgi:hypothetical protein